MQVLARIVAESEDRLVRSVLTYAKSHGYVQYTDTLEQACHLSMQGLSRSLLSGIERFKNTPNFGPDEPYCDDPLTAFGLAEAVRNRKRGFSLAMFLGLFKYYKHAYIELVEEQIEAPAERAECRYFLERCFDRIEVAFCRRWSEGEQSDLLNALQTTARTMTDEKNAYLTVFESLSDAVVLLDPAGTVIHMNQRASVLADAAHIPGTQYRVPLETSAAPAGLHRWGRSLETVFPQLVPFFQAAPAEENPPVPPVVEMELNGAIRHFEINHSTMLDGAEKLTAHIITLRDVTERKAVEETLRRRSIDIERLRQWESLGMLTSGLAHDFNNLLAVIASRCRAVKRKSRCPEDDTVETMNHVLEAVERGVELIKTMRACSGRESRGTTSQNLSLLVETWAKDTEERLPNQVRFTVTADSTLPNIPLNREQVLLILNQLFTNALEAVGSGSGRISIRTGAGHEARVDGYREPFYTEPIDGEFVYLEISDSGEGIKDEVFSKIFDPFFSTKFIGRGLGLAAVRGAVVSHNGTVRIKTGPGKGSAFQILFPTQSKSSESIPPSRKGDPCST